MMRFLNRTEAGRHLAARLGKYARHPDVIVLALPRGGVPVAYEVAQALDVPLDVFLVRKLGVPGHPELAMGAIASGGVRILSHDLIDELGIALESVDLVTASERTELQRREQLYRGNRLLPDLRGRTVILIDDGLATGATMEAAVEAVRALGPARVIVGAPVGAAETCQRLRQHADEVICAEAPYAFQAVGLWYVDFDQTTDEEVLELLHRAQESRQLTHPHTE